MKYVYFLLIIILFGCSDPSTSNSGLSISQGRVDRIENFESKFVVSRNIDVWLPEDYSKEQKYAVLYMHDGQMLFDSTTTWNKQEWGVDETMSSLLGNKKIKRTIVVGIWNTEYRHSEYFPQKPFEKLPIAFQDSLLSMAKRNKDKALFKVEVKSDDYLQFIVKELKPFIDSKYATNPNRENTLIAGSSMGGLISMYAMCEYPDVFGGAGCLSTHWVGTFDTLNNPIPKEFISYLQNNLPEAASHKLYFDYGTETLDALYEPYQKRVDAVVSNKGYDSDSFKSLKFEGDDHSERSWNRRLRIPLKFLLEKN